MGEEIWRDVVGYEELYKVSNMGRILTHGKGTTKLTDQQIIEIRELFNNGIKGKILANIYNSEYSNIMLIVNNKSRVKPIEDKLNKLYSNNRGYLQAFISKNGKGKKCLIHRLVAEAFLEMVDGKCQVNHKNGNKEDNRLENLEYCNNSENHQHAYNTGLRPKGELHHSSKLTDLDVQEIRDIYKTGNISYFKLAKAYNVSGSQIGRIVNNQRRVV